MSIIPSGQYSNHLAMNTLINLKKGNARALGEFIWQNQERFYVIAYLSCGNEEIATKLTINAFHKAFTAISESDLDSIQDAWLFLSQFIVDSCAQYHQEGSPPKPDNPINDPNMDGSDQIDLQSAITFSSQRIKYCLSAVSEEQQKTFILRHQLKLTYTQIANVLNKHTDDILSWLFRARVQIIKCLAQG